MAPIESAADRAVFANADEFGVVVSWTAGVATTQIAALFDNEQIETDQFAEGPPQLTRRGVLTFAEDLLPAGAAEGDAVSVAITVPSARTLTGTVAVIERDGTGMCVVRIFEDVP